MQALRMYYKHTLKALVQMPSEYEYRKQTEKLINDRLKHINSTIDVQELEKKINCGQIEEVVIQASREMTLATKMLVWKPWEPLIEEAPENQWKWPV